MKHENIILFAIVIILLVIPLAMYSGGGDDTAVANDTANDTAAPVAIANSFSGNISIALPDGSNQTVEIINGTGNFSAEEEAEIFGGSDDQGSDGVVEAYGGNYTPWFNSIWEPPSGEIESLLFAVQAAIGAIIVGYFFGYWRGGKKEE